MELNELITRRKSTRSYTNVPVDSKTLEKILAFAAKTKPLDTSIRVRWEVLSRTQVNCLCPWTTPQLLAIFTEERAGALENVGFLVQQVDLFLHSLGLGSCWLGMGRLNETSPVKPAGEDGLKFAIMLAFGHPKGELLRSGPKAFRRKALSQISDQPDTRLEPARLAPSSVNSQPWFFTHEKEVIHAYCAEKGLLKNKFLSDMNRIDMGIALAHMYVTHPNSFRFFRADAVSPIGGYQYIGSFAL